MNQVPRCKICCDADIGEWLDFGPQSLTNRYLPSATGAEYVHPLAIGFCRNCGTVQLRDRVPAEEMRARFDWISYNEPENHLDALAVAITRLPGVSSDSVIGGLTYKDASTLSRLRRLGCENTWLVDATDDLGAETTGIESIQACLTVPTARRIVTRHGLSQVIVFRHVLEHSSDPHQTIDCLKSLLTPNGYIVAEMPDARRALKRCDYSTVWEEHLFYFTPMTLRHFLVRCGLELVSERSIFYSLENSLVVIAKQAATKGHASITPRPSSGEIRRAKRFLREFPAARTRVQDLLREIRRLRGPIAFLGAGHLSASYINLYSLRDLVEFVVDDDVNKQGLFMPGSRLPILPTGALLERGVAVCLMGVRPEIEDVVFVRNQTFLDRGGTLASIFPESRYAMDRITGLRKAG